MIEKLKEMAFIFACITTGSSIAAAFFISVFLKETLIDANILWQILATSAICCLGLLIYPSRKLSKFQHYVLHVIHYLYTLGVVIAAGLFFDWFDPKPLLLFAMAASVTIVFVIIMWISYRCSQRESSMINDRLYEYQRKHHSS